MVDKRGKKAWLEAQQSYQQQLGQAYASVVNGTTPYAASSTSQYTVPNNFVYTTYSNKTSGMPKYKILHAPTLEELETKLNDEGKNGYQPASAITTTVGLFTVIVANMNIY